MADRENGRIQCFLAETGEFVKEIKKEEFGGKVFAITYSPVGGETPPAHSTIPSHPFILSSSHCLILSSFHPPLTNGAAFFCDSKTRNDLKCVI